MHATLFSCLVLFWLPVSLTSLPDLSEGVCSSQWPAEESQQQFIVRFREYRQGSDWKLELVRIRRLRVALKPTVGDLKTRDRQAELGRWICLCFSSDSYPIAIWRMLGLNSTPRVASTQNLLPSWERLWFNLKLSRAVYDRLVSTTSQSGGVWSTERCPMAR